MFRLAVLGQPPADLKTLKLVLKNVPELCEVQYFKLLTSEADVDETPYGPHLMKLDQLQTGVYDLWQDTGYGFYQAQLMLAGDKVMLNGEIVGNRTSRQKPGEVTYKLDKAVLASFQQLLSSSLRSLLVYQEGDDPARREYVLIWPNEMVRTTHDTKRSYRLLGMANLATGLIEEYPHILTEDGDATQQG